MREPFSQEAEQALLGAMMLKPEMIDALSGELVAEDFYWVENAEIYRGVLALHSAGRKIDAVSIGDHLQDIKITGGGYESALYYAGMLAKNTPSAANAMTYAQIVRERSVDRSLIAAGDLIRELGHTGGDLADKVAQAQALVLGLDTKTSVHETRAASDVLMDHVEELQRRQDLGGALDGLSTGNSDLDKQLGGLKGGDLIVIAGRPAMGKTAFAVNIAESVAVEQGKSVLIVSLEMTNGALMDRILASLGKIPLPALKDGSATSDYGTELTAAAWKVKNSNLYMSDRPGMTAPRLRSLARRHKQRYGLDLLVLDYLQLMEGSGRGGNRTEDVSDMTRQAKLMARELDCPVIILSQLNRGLEQRPNKRPMMADLRESGAIEQDADIIMFVYRDEVYHPETDQKGIAEIIIGKARNSEIGTVRTAFLGKYSRFERLADFRVSNPKETAAPVARLADRFKGRQS